MIHRHSIYILYHHMNVYIYMVELPPPKTSQISTSTRTYLSRIIPSQESFGGEVGHRWNVINWVLVSTPLKNISQIGNIPQVENKTYLKPPTGENLILLMLGDHEPASMTTATTTPWTKPHASLHPLDSCNPPSVGPGKTQRWANRVQHLLHLFHNHMINLDICNASIKHTIPRKQMKFKIKKYLLNLLFTLKAVLFRTLSNQWCCELHAKSFFELCSESLLDLLAGPLEQFPPHALWQALESLRKADRGEPLFFCRNGS